MFDPRLRPVLVIRLEEVPARRKCPEEVPGTQPHPAARSRGPGATTLDAAPVCGHGHRPGATGSPQRPRPGVETRYLTLAMPQVRHHTRGPTGKCQVAGLDPDDRARGSSPSWHPGTTGGPGRRPRTHAAASTVAALAVPPWGAGAATAPAVRAAVKGGGEGRCRGCAAVCGCGCGAVRVFPACQAGLLPRARLGESRLAT